MTKDSEEAILLETGRLAARLIHDFKNQLGGLKLYAAYLQKRFSGNEEGMEVAEKIIKGLNEMAEQAAILNKLCRPLELRMESGDLAPVLEQVLGRLAPRNEAKRLKIIPRFEAAPHSLSLDARLTGEALEAIIARALDASPEGGKIEISLGRINQNLRIEIIDYGPPLDDARRLSFFDPLGGDRLNRTALSLAMARRIIESHGGEVSARANNDASSGGTIVEVRLPIAD